MLKYGIQFKDADLKILIEEAIKKNRAIRIQAKGNSMFPSIKNKEIVTIYSYGKRNPIVGDIAAFILPGREQKLLIHRIIEAKERFLFKGDNLRKTDGVVDRADILGIVGNIKNGNVHSSVQSKQKIMAWLSKYNLIFIINKIFLHIRHIFCLEF